MIRWKEIDPPMSRKLKRRWRDAACANAESRDGRCVGLSGSEGDDEPCEICKACDKLEVEQ